MRRLVPELPYARSAIWARRLAIVGGLMATGAVVVPRRGILTASIALLLLEVGLAVAVLAVPCGVAAAVVIWRTGWLGIGRAIAGVLIAGLVLAYPGYLAVSVARDLPAADLSTDPQDPPQISTTRREERPGSAAQAWDLAWLFGQGAAHSAEPSPVLLDDGPAQAYRAALKVAKTLRWRVVSSSAPGAGPARFEAVAASAVMRLPEDIGVRVTERDGQTRVDVRSAFRLSGLPLVGRDNARNIQAFCDALEDQAAEN